jgi:hypothetical protein
MHTGKVIYVYLVLSAFTFRPNSLLASIKIYVFLYGLIMVTYNSTVEISLTSDLTQCFPNEPSYVGVWNLKPIRDLCVDLDIFLPICLFLPSM